jgi:hypothetical protein
MKNFIKANYLFSEVNCKIVPSSPKRKWMDETPSKFAYRCLPLSMANQCTYDVLAPSTIKATWYGGVDSNKMIVEYLGDKSFSYASSEFGSGILTFHVDFVITSSFNTSIYVKGPANQFKKNINALEGIVETHWLPFTFTANWKFFEPGEVIFEKDEPIFSFFPINLDYIESFDAQIGKIEDNKIFKNKYDQYCNSRSKHIEEGHTDGKDWQKYYMKGISPGCTHVANNHKSNIKLKKFK